MEESWDLEYERGRYVADPPVAFVRDILTAARSEDVLASPSLYVGCGNGRNYVPLVQGGFEDLLGIDASPIAVDQLVRRSRRRTRAIVGTVGCLAPEARFATVIGIQVFQHGARAVAHSHIEAARRLLAPGGLFCIRVNSADTDVEHRHEIVETHDDGGFTIRYLDGPKEGLGIHFFSKPELEGLLGEGGATAVLELRRSTTVRIPPHEGQWSQWEAIYRAPGSRFAR